MKSTLYIASSINGFMTRGESDSGWVSDKDERIFADYCRQTGCVLVGRKTYDQYLNIVYPVPGTHNIVLTSQERSSDNMVHYATSLEAAIEKISTLGLDRFITVGGANVIGQVLEAGYVDEILLSLHPYVFAKGLPIMGGFTKDLDLKFTGIVEQQPELVLLRYAVNPQSSS